MGDEAPKLDFKLPPEVEKMFAERPGQHLEWGWMCLNTDIRFIRDYVESTAEAFDAAFERFDANVAEAAAKTPNWLGPEDHEHTRAFNLAEHFPRFAWQATFVAIYSFLEDQMIRVAGGLGRALELKLTPDDLRYGRIFAAKTYLKELCGIDFPEAKHPWQEILKYNPIRNAIVHGNGHVWAKDHKMIANYARGKKSIDYVNDRIRLSKEFCLEAVENVDKLLSELYTLALAKIPKDPE